MFNIFCASLPYTQETSAVREVEGSMQNQFHPEYNSSTILQTASAVPQPHVENMTHETGNKN